MEFKTNIGTIVVTIIILLVATPKTGYLMDYRLDYCNDYDQIDESGLFRAVATESVGIDKNGFYACEIGFINANVEVTIDVLALNACDTYYLISDNCNFEFFILNKIVYLKILFELFNFLRSYRRPHEQHHDGDNPHHKNNT